MVVNVPSNFTPPNINNKQMALILHQIYIDKFNGKTSDIFSDRRKKISSKVFRNITDEAFRNFFKKNEVDSFIDAVRKLDLIVDKVLLFFTSDEWKDMRTDIFIEASIEIEIDERYREKRKKRIAKYRKVFKETKI